MNPIIVYGGLGVLGMGALILAAPASANIVQDVSSDMIPINYGAPNLNAFLKVLRLGESDDDYSALYGGGSFSSFAQHPAIRTTSNPDPFQGSDNSHAAGAYQAQPGTWRDFMASEGQCDFSPSNQDRFAVWDIKRRGAYSDVLMGDIEAAMYKLRAEWTSLADRGVDWVIAQYQTAGGILA